MREFELRNGMGETWNLTCEESFLSSPKGLGGERKTTYVQVNNNYIATEDAIKQKSITGKAVFEGYDNFEKFCRFVQHRPLTLVYRAAHEYMMQVALEKLTKTEMEVVGLQGEVTFKGLTAWHRIIHCEKMADGEGKKYPYQYDYIYAENVIGNIEFVTDSTEKCPVRLIIIGPCKNPEWKLYVNGTMKTTGKISCTIEKGNRIVVDAMSVPYEITEYNQNGDRVRDLYQDSDFETGRFLYAGYGDNKISVAHEGNAAIRAAAEVRVEYGAV